MLYDERALTFVMKICRLPTQQLKMFDNDEAQLNDEQQKFHFLNYDIQSAKLRILAT